MTRAQTITGAGGITAALDVNAHRYEVRGGAPPWIFAGHLPGRPTAVRTEDCVDGIGRCRALRFSWGDFAGSIRVYADTPVVLFSVTVQRATKDALRFPAFTELPRGWHGFSYGDSAFAPPRARLEQTGTPWLLFDGATHAVVISPAANQMIASLWGDGRQGIASGLNAAVASLPAAFTHATLMAFADGPNAAWEGWGRGLTALQGRPRPGNDADVSLRYLGYWTDNGASYYYDYDPSLGYEGTLKALVRRYRSEDIPVRYLQLDSWWYFKTYTDPAGRTGKAKNEQLPQGEWNRYGGLMRYEAHPSLFPQGLAAFQDSIGLPLIAHDRWVDPASAYHARYRILGLAALDPGFWREVIGYLADAGGVTYEQDWLDVIYQRSPQLQQSLDAGSTFTDEMAQAAQERGLTLQYSMALPRHFLQGARYPNLTTIRVSGDRFGRDKWDDFLFTSRLASALGIWPWCDVFMSRETDNLLLATLSAGPVGIGDRMGEEQRDSLLRSVRPDGVIIKPDAPLVPLDAMYGAGTHQPMLAAAHTLHGALRTAYVFAYGRDRRTRAATFKASELGIAGEAYVYDAGRGGARLLHAGERFDFAVPAQASIYLIVVPVARAGLAFFGDSGKFVPDGRRRIAAMDDAPERLTVRVHFSPQEKSLRLFGYARRRPTVTAEAGSVGELVFEPVSGRFEVTVMPGPTRELEEPGDDPVYRADLTFMEPAG